MGEVKANSEGAFLYRFFELLNQNKVRYAVLRNWETLPDSLGGSDLDLLTDSTESAQTVLRIADQTAKEQGGKITSLYSVEATVLTLGGKNDDGVLWGLHIDLFPGLTFFGIPYFSTEDVLDEAIFEDKGYYRCSDLGNVVSFLKECLHNKSTKKDYYPSARVVYRKKTESVRRAFQGYYGKKCEKLLMGLLENECSVDEIRSASVTLVKGLWTKQLSASNWHRLLWVKVKRSFRRSSRIFKPPGYCVAFLGTDGAGKSSVINEVMPFLTKMMHHETVYQHLRPNLLPAIAQLFGRPSSIGPTTDPHAGKVSGGMGSIVRLLYYVVDYCFGYWLKIFPIIVKRPTMVVFDRYFYDYLIDQKRFCIKLPRWAIKFVCFFVPSPDLIVCLGTDPETIHARKPELTCTEVARQVAALKVFCESNKRAVWIDTGCSVEESVNKILEITITRMAARYEGVG